MLEPDGQSPSPQESRHLELPLACDSLWDASPRHSRDVGDPREPELFRPAATGIGPAIVCPRVCVESWGSLRCKRGLPPRLIQALRQIAQFECPAYCRTLPWQIVLRELRYFLRVCSCF